MAVATKPIKRKVCGIDEVVIADRDRAVELLERVLGLVSDTAFGPADAWETLHDANAFLVAHGRGTPDRFATARAEGFPRKAER